MSRATRTEISTRRPRTRIVAALDPAKDDAASTLRTERGRRGNPGSLWCRRRSCGRRVSRSRRLPHHSKSSFTFLRSGRNLVAWLLRD